MTNEEHKIELTILKNNLVDNLAIFHERVTLLIQLTIFEIQDTQVNFQAKIIKPLDKKHAEKNNLYKHMILKNLFLLELPIYLVSMIRALLFKATKLVDHIVLSLFG